jgi:hypothetical protein
MKSSLHLFPLILPKIVLTHHLSSHDPCLPDLFLTSEHLLGHGVDESVHGVGPTFVRTLKRLDLVHRFRFYLLDFTAHEAVINLTSETKVTLLHQLLVRIDQEVAIIVLMVPLVRLYSDF